MNRTKIWIVARHEFLTTVKRIAFLLVTLGTPILAGGLMLLAHLTTAETAQTQRIRVQDARIFLLDLTGESMFAVTPENPFPEEHRKNWFPVGTREEAEHQLRDRENATAVILPENYLATGNVEILTSLTPSLLQQVRIPTEFQKWMRLRIAGGNLSEQQLTRVRSLIEQQEVYYLSQDPNTPHETQSEFLIRMLSGGLFAFIFFVALMSSGGYLIQGLADEKENRVFETVMSSVTPTELMIGKLLGLGAAGLLQVAVWTLMGAGTFILFASLLLNLSAAVFCMVFFLLGYLFYGSLMLGVGALGSNMREATQYTASITMLALTPLFFLTTLLANPSGTIARVLSFIPFTAPFTMMLRYMVNPSALPWWEIAVSLIILAGSTYFGVKLAARLYRVGLLLYGKRPTPREILRWIRSADA